MTAGQEYVLEFRGYSRAASGTATLTVAGRTEAADGGTASDVSGSKVVTFDGEFTLPVPAERDNWLFRGWADEDGVMYTDATGAGIRVWDKAEETGKAGALRGLIKFSNAMLKMGIDMRAKLFKSVTSTFGGNLKGIICGGAPLKPFLPDFFDSIGITLINGYGISECGEHGEYEHHDSGVDRQRQRIDEEYVDEHADIYRVRDYYAVYYS